MGKHKLREDKKCQNCGGFVRKRFCPKCGQENVETRQSFHYLFTHFIEDLLHYDGSFWKTVKNLLFKPGVLTREYLDGKRKKYVAPVKLYIFVSFFVFFVGGIINKFTADSNFDGFGINKPKKPITEIEITEEQRKKDSITVAINSEKWPIQTLFKEYDSIQKSLPEHKRDKGIRAMLLKKETELKQRYTKYDLGIKITEVASKNIPKFLFFYMPVFAFLMWLFHNKRRWYYFDHGIFTLHYFSFLLLFFFVTISILEPLSKIPIVQNEFFYILFSIIHIILYLWLLIYFFKAHRKVYGYSRIKTFFRGMFLFFVNTIFFILGIVLYFFLIFFMM